MIAIILVAGKGLRMRPLTLFRPKPLLEISNKTILEHNLGQLDGIVKEAVLVIGYKGEMIKGFIGNQFKNIKIRYVLQKKRLGTGHAVKKAIPYIKDKFILMNGDDLYNRNDIKRCIKKFPSILLAKVEKPENFGVVITSKNIVKSLIEKPKKPVSNLVNCGFYFLDKSIFNFKIKKSSRGEYEVTDYIKKLIEKEKLYWVNAQKWIPIFPCLEVFKENEFLLKKCFNYGVK